MQPALLPWSSGKSDESQAVVEPGSFQVMSLRLLGVSGRLLPAKVKNCQVREQTHLPGSATSR